MKLIGILLSLLFIFGCVEPVVAASETSNLVREQLKQQDELGNKAFAATNEGDFAAAEEYWTQFLEKFPDNAAVWSNRGNSRISQNKLEEAIADFNKSIELAPNVTDPYLNRGTALEGLGRWDEAIADYNHILELDPNDAMAYYNRGNAKAG